LKLLLLIERLKKSQLHLERVGANIRLNHSWKLEGMQVDKFTTNERKLKFGLNFFNTMISVFVFREAQNFEQN